MQKALSFRASARTVPLSILLFFAFRIKCHLKITGWQGEVTGTVHCQDTGGSETPLITDAALGSSLFGKLNLPPFSVLEKNHRFLPPQKSYLLQKLGAGVLRGDRFYLSTKSRGPELHPIGRKGRGTNVTACHSQHARTRTHGGCG